MTYTLFTILQNIWCSKQRLCHSDYFYRHYYVYAEFVSCGDVRHQHKTQYEIKSQKLNEAQLISKKVTIFCQRLLFRGKFTSLRSAMERNELVEEAKELGLKMESYEQQSYAVLKTIQESIITLTKLKGSEITSAKE